jgi:hypothetical protein
MRWAPVWAPPAELRAVRHQINNLLAPVVVAAEILDDGSETAELLTRSVARLRDVSNRMGELIHQGEPTLRTLTLAEILTVCLPGCPDPSTGAVLRADPERLLANVFTELDQLLAGSRDAGDVPAVTRCTLIPAPESLAAATAVLFTVTLPDHVAVHDVGLLPVPFAVAGADVRLATVCREVSLQGGLVGFDASTSSLGVCLPLL